MKIPMKRQMKKDEKPKNDFAYFQCEHHSSVCQMLYIDAMFRKTGYAPTFTLPSKSHQMCCYCCVFEKEKKRRNHFTSCISWNMPFLVYYILHRLVFRMCAYME